MIKETNSSPLPQAEKSCLYPKDKSTPKEIQTIPRTHAPAVSFTGRVKRKKRKILISIIIALAAILLAYSLGTLILYARLAPQLGKLGLAEAEREIRQRINDEVVALSETGKLDGTDLIRVRRNTAGRIISLEADAGEMNRMRALLVDRLSKALEKKRGFTLSVPAGSLTDSGILSWMSLPIRVKYTPLGAVTGDIYTEFSDSGVNQTKYSVFAELRISYLLLLPGENPTAEAVTRLPLGEVVIVGEVPHLYTSEG